MIYAIADRAPSPHKMSISASLHADHENEDDLMATVMEFVLCVQ